MASRAKQKEEARARRLAEQQALAEKTRRERRLRMVGGVVLVAAALVAVAIAISSSGGTKKVSTNSPAAKQAANHVDSLLAGIPESGATLGNPNAKVTMTEFGDLKCPVCADFAKGPESQVITSYVRTGKVKLVYKSLCTATCNGPQPNVFPTQQAAAYSAGLQGKAWYYIELFYNLQGDETTSYVDANFLDNLAKLVPGLNFNTWQLDSKNSSLLSQVTAEQQSAQSQGFSSTPTVTFTGPKGSAQPLVGFNSYSAYQSAISKVT